MSDSEEDEVIPVFGTAREHGADASKPFSVFSTENQELYTKITSGAPLSEIFGDSRQPLDEYFERRLAVLAKVNCHVLASLIDKAAIVHRLTSMPSRAQVLDVLSRNSLSILCQYLGEFPDMDQDKVLDYVTLGHFLEQLHSLCRGLNAVGTKNLTFEKDGVNHSSMEAKVVRTLLREKHTVAEVQKYFTTLAHIVVYKGYLTKRR